VVLNGSVSSAGVVDISADDSITLADGVSISAGAGLTLNATTISAGTGVTLQSDSNGDGKGDLDVEADAITGGANLIAGPDATHPTASITATAFDGDLELGGVTGVIVTLNAFNGDVTLEGPSTIGQALTVGASGGAISILGDVTSGGTIDLTASDTLSFGGGVTVKAADHLIGAASSISIGANAVVASDSDHDGAGELTLHAPGDIIADATSSVDGGHATVTLTSDNGQLALGAVSGGDIILSSALDLTVGGNIQARGALSATSTTGGVLVKSSVSSGGDMDLTATTTLAISANANVLAGGHLHGTGVTITVGAKDVLRSDTGGQGGARDLDLHASGALTADATSLIAGGANLTAPVTLETDGGALSAGAISGSTISVSSSAATTLGGALNAATDISAGGTSIAVNGNATSGGGIDLETAGVITIAANLTLKAAADLTVGGSVVTIGAGDTLQADSAGTGGSELFVNATGAVNADATSTLLAGPSLANPTGFVLVEAGGDIHLGQVAADEVEVFTQGDITLAGPVHGVSAVFIDPANITVLGDITSDGLIALQTESGGAISIGANVKVTSTGDEVLLVSDGDLTIGGGASVTGVSLLASTGGVLHLASGASLNTTGQATAPTWPIVPDTIQPGGEGPVNVTGLNIEAAGLDLQGSLVAGKAGARDDIYIQIVDAPQTVTVGGADSAGGVHISNAAIGRMTARNLIIMAGAGDGAGANADILVQDLALNSANLSALALGTASDNTITVAGQVTLQGPGPVDLHLGFAGSGTPFGLPSGPNVGGAAPPLQGFIPGEIDITGSLGQSGAAFNSTVLLARNDIFMGSAAFIAAAKADPAFDAGKQSSAYTVDQDHVFVASHGLELAAQGRIIQQNTGGSLRYAGLLIGTPVTGHPLVSDPATLDGQTVGDVEQDAGWIPNYALGPTRVDLFGVVTRPDASTTHGVDAALEPNLSAPVIADVSHYKINTCVFATHCVGTTPPRIELPDADQAQDQADQAAAAASQSPTTFAESIQIDDTSDDRKDANGAPVTESGNGDLWTGPPSSPK
jgi:filamentous hemagglutinin